MTFIVDSDHHGTAEATWLAAITEGNIPQWEWGTPARVVVLAPHPDDEVLALGGSLIRLANRGCRIEVIAITNGEASHPKSRVFSKMDIAEIRRAERQRALDALGLSNVEVTELEIPDGAVHKASDLAERLAPKVRGARFCIAPWRQDGHPDHDATGEAAALACAREGARLLEYIVWGWHWATPRSEKFPWRRLHKMALHGHEHAAKLKAIEAYRSQIHSLEPGQLEVVLPEPVLARFRRPFEMLLS